MAKKKGLPAVVVIPDFGLSSEDRKRLKEKLKDVFVNTLRPRRLMQPEIEMDIEMPPIVEVPRRGWTTKR